MNRTIMIHTVSGAIFCIGEELFRELLADKPLSKLAVEMREKLLQHLDCQD